MDQTAIAAFRKSLETIPTAELQHILDTGEKSNRSPAELEAMRELLAERSRRNRQFALAAASAVILGLIGAVATWSQSQPAGIILFVCAGCAIAGFASFYIPGLFGA